MEPGLNSGLSRETFAIHSWKAFNRFLGHNRELEIKTQLFYFSDPSKDFRTLGPCSNNGKSCFDKFWMVKSRNDFFTTESRKRREGLNRLNNFEVFSVEKS